MAADPRISGEGRHSPRREPGIAWEGDRSDPRHPSPRTLAFATAALPLGFAVAEATGVRPIGGAVMAALAIAALITSRSSAPRRAAWTLMVLALFITSHAIADPIGTIPAIAVVTVAAGVAAFWLLQPAPSS